jgi:NADH dehydrogenase [ubiquinone] 1 alpha subcomplex assembly factor 7
MSKALRARIAARIRAQGPLTVAQYMDMALWDPAQGYYATRDPLGARGDFITAPEISQVFGELIGAWLADFWQRSGAPDPVALCELGPGRGTLMADALRAAETLPAFRKAIRLHLIEAGAALREAQRKTLGAANPSWHRNFADLPDGPLLLVANEFLDALPIRQFERRADGWHERRIGLGTGDGLAFATDARPDPGFVRPWPLGSVAEERPAAEQLARAVGTRIVRHGGAALFLDYGYFPAAPGDTFQAVAHHRYADPLTDPGASDLTTHVDFAAFAHAAELAGARAWGPVAQGRFLESLGIAARVERLGAGKDAAAAESIRTAARRLIEPAQMGSLFKALALTSATAPVPAGFAA